jgi:putative ABC transport system permease protein
MAKSPGFTAIAILTLALGIGANTAIFSVVNAAILRPLPFPNAPKLVEVFHVYSKLNMSHVTVSPASYMYIRDNSKALEQYAAFTGFRAPQNMTGVGDPQHVDAVLTTWNLFNVLGVKPTLGRVFTAEDDKPGSRVAVLSHKLWRDKFGSDPSVVGRDVTLDGANYSIIGVMPKGFEYPNKVQLYVPLAMSSEQMANEGAEFLNTIGTLRQGVTRAQLDEDMRRLAAEQLRRDNDTTNAPGWSIAAAPLQEMTVADMRKALWVLLAAVGCVLLIACANVANLLLARATARQKEIAIRTALGASRWRLVRQMLTEGAALGLLGGAFGLVLGYWCLNALLGLVPIQIPSFIHIEIDRTVMLFTLVLGVVTGLLFSVLPSFQITSGNANEALKQGGKTSAGTAHPRVRGAIVALQLAFAVVLLISAGLLIKTFVRIQQSSPGFDPQGVLTGAILLPEQKYAKDWQRTNFFSEVLERMRTQPGVKEAAISSSLPLNIDWMNSFDIEGKAFQVRPHAHVAITSPEYFSTMKIPLVSGRGFAQTDKADSERIVIVDANVARAYFGADDPVGKHILISLPQHPKNAPFTIIGVVGAVKHTNPLENETKGQLYFPYTQVSIPYSWVVLRTDGDPGALSEPLRKQVLAIDATQPLDEVKPMEDRLNEFVAQPRFNMMLLGIFAGLALVLSAIGVYGVMAYSVTQRTHEIGVRMALGARRSDVLQMILNQAVKLAAIGVIVGVIGGLMATRALSSMLFGVKPADPATFIGITALLAAITVLAGLVPAFKATRVDPMIALHYE